MAAVRHTQHHLTPLDADHQAACPSCELLARQVGPDVDHPAHLIGSFLPSAFAGDGDAIEHSEGHG
ncbi:hypothetical protein, partial [Streptomyces malaysiensis]|uniref:hypothetical protein n=1 Tax=Streptomyces malaysiensis TaxID=92644 RepID=UPI0031FDBB3D